MPRYPKLEPPSSFVLHEYTSDEVRPGRSHGERVKGWVAQHLTRPEVKSPQYSRRSLAIEWAWKWVGMQASQGQQERQEQPLKKRRARDGAGAETV